MSPLLADSWDSLIPVAVFAIGILFSLFQRAFQRSRRSDRSEPGGWEGSPEVLDEGTEVESGGRVLRRYVRPAESTTAPPPLPRSSGSWEQELERVLQRRLPQPFPPPALPPVTSVEPAPVPESEARWKPVRITLEHPIDHTTSIEDLSARDLESLPIDPASLSSAVESGERIVATVDLEERVRRMMERVGGQVRHVIPVTATTATSSKAKASGIPRGWIAGLRHPTTARQAMLASLVLGRPRSLEA